jgi:small subunit ribosomal protein S8
MKEKGHIDYVYNKDEKTLVVTIIKLNMCHAVKPRYSTDVGNIDKYLRRFLPSRNFGSLIISTNKGLLTHQDALANKIGGSLMAYFY